MILDKNSFREHGSTRFIIDKDILGFPGYKDKLKETRQKTGLASAMVTGNGTVMNLPVVYCGTEFGFFGGSYCMSSGEKIWQAAKISLKEKLPMIVQACGGGARMHEGCSSMVSIPKAHIALTQKQMRVISAFQAEGLLNSMLDTLFQKISRPLPGSGKMVT